MRTIQKTGMAIFLMVSFLFVFNGSAWAQSSKKTVKIKTTAVCDMCKEKIEKALAYEKGIKSSNLDVPTKIITVVYDESKTTPEKIRVAISKTGYDADDVKADKAAYDKLPACCKSGKPCTHDQH